MLLRAAENNALFVLFSGRLLGGRRVEMMISSETHFFTNLNVHRTIWATLAPLWADQDHFETISGQSCVALFVGDTLCKTLHGSIHHD